MHGFGLVTSKKGKRNNTTQAIKFSVFSTYEKSALPYLAHGVCSNYVRLFRPRHKQTQTHAQTHRKKRNGGFVTEKLYRSDAEIGVANENYFGDFKESVTL